MTKIDFLIASVEAVKEEEDLPKNVIDTLNKIKEILSNEEDVYSKKDKCINELEELEANNTIEAGIRVQLLDIASQLEQL